MQRAVTVLVIALCAMALPPLAAQQANSPPPAAGTSVAPASSTSTALPGPRLQPEYRRFEPGVTDSSANLMSGGSHTFVISTLALVLIVVIIVLLVVK